ncbi:MAG TPA: hypothetical protein VNA21_06195 [Steroidobacteraceae bacterium]|nr:hypothetical protein [Steroidobacteraceae bacterium]
MKMVFRHLIGCALAVLAASTATATPVALDTEQKAAAGVGAALHTSHSVPLLLTVLSDGVIQQVERALAALNGQTTVAALIATRGGIMIACDAGGSVKAKMANALPRVLHLTWTGCTTPIFEEAHTFNGTAVITLPADTFAPDSVDAIRLGSVQQPFVEQFSRVFPEFADTITISYAASLRGDISLTRTFGSVGQIIGASSYEVHGYREEQISREFPSALPETFGSRISAQKLMVVADIVTSEDRMLVDDDLQFLSGSILNTRMDPPPYGTTTQSYRLNGYRVRTITDWANYHNQLFVDGKVNITWNPFFGAGCVNGTYSFRTRAPMISQEINEARFAAGELAVNGSVVARFFAPQNVPPRLPAPVNGMLINLRVTDVGSFNYDTASYGQTLVAVGQCQS